MHRATMSQQDSLPDYPKLVTWTSDDVSHWLKGLKLNDAVKAFRNLNINGFELANITESAIFQTGISMKSRKKILDYVANIKGKDTQGKRGSISRSSMADFVYDSLTRIIRDKKPPATPRPDYQDQQSPDEEDETPWNDDWSDEDEYDLDTNEDYLPPVIPDGNAKTTVTPPVPSRYTSPPRRNDPRQTVSDTSRSRPEPEGEEYEEPETFRRTFSVDSDPEDYEIPVTGEEEEEYIEPDPDPCRPSASAAPLRSRINGHTQSTAHNARTTSLTVEPMAPPRPTRHNQNVAAAAARKISDPVGRQTTPKSPSQTAAPRKFSDGIAKEASPRQNLPSPSSATQRRGSSDASISPKFGPRKMLGNSSNAFPDTDTSSSAGSDSGTRFAPSKSKPRPSPPLTNRDDVTRQPWYHGDIDRDTATGLLNRHKTTGMFLVRTRPGEPDCPFALSIYYKKVYNLRIRCVSGAKYALGNVKQNEMTFNTVLSLVSFYQSNVLLLDGPDGTELKLACPKT